MLWSSSGLSWRSTDAGLPLEAGVGTEALKPRPGAQASPFAGPLLEGISDQCWETSAFLGLGIPDEADIILGLEGVLGNGYSVIEMT